MKLYIKKLAVLFVLLFVAVSFYQNCSPADFSSLALSGLCPEGKTCDQLNFATKSEDQYPLIKVVLLVDNSFSMDVMQAKLARSLDTLYEGFKGKTLEVYVLTTTHLSKISYGSNQNVKDSSGSYASFVNSTTYQYKRL